MGRECYLSNLSEIELSIKAVLLLFLLLSVCKVHHCSDDETFTRMSKSLYISTSKGIFDHYFNTGIFGSKEGEERNEDERMIFI